MLLMVLFTSWYVVLLQLLLRYANLILFPTLVVVNEEILTHGKYLS